MSWWECLSIGQWEAMVCNSDQSEPGCPGCNWLWRECCCQVRVLGAEVTITAILAGCATQSSQTIIWLDLNVSSIPCPCYVFGKNWSYLHFTKTVSFFIPISLCWLIPGSSARVYCRPGPACAGLGMVVAVGDWRSDRALVTPETGGWPWQWETSPVIRGDIQDGHDKSDDGNVMMMAATMNNVMIFPACYNSQQHNSECAVNITITLSNLEPNGWHHPAQLRLSDFNARLNVIAENEFCAFLTAYFYILNISIFADYKLLDWRQIKHSIVRHK